MEASKRIDEKIRELGEWRGETLSEVRRIKEHDQIDEAALKSLIREAVALNLA